MVTQVRLGKFEVVKTLVVSLLGKIFFKYPKFNAVLLKKFVDPFLVILSEAKDLDSSVA
jgi:hypothetical protein